MDRLESQIYEKALDDYARLLDESPERALFYETEATHTPLEIEESRLSEDTRSGLVDYGFEPIVRVETLAKQKHPLFASSPPERFESEYWWNREGILAELDTERDQRYLVVTFSDATQYAVWPEPGANRIFPVEAREVVVSSGSLGHDLETVRARIDQKIEAGHRVLPVVDARTADLHRAMFAAYFSAEMPAGVREMLDSSQETMKSARRQEITVVAACLALSALLGLIFSSWMVFGAGLIITGLCLYVLHRWVQNIVDDALKFMEVQNDE